MTSLRQTASSIEEEHDGDDDDDDNAQRTSGSSNNPISKFFRGDRDLSVPTVLLAAFLNLLGFTMTQPIQPALGKHFGLPLGASYGSLLSAYPLGMMFGVFLWPTLSDVLGRKIVMSLTLFGSGMGLSLQGYGIRAGWTLERFLAAKVLTGFFSGNSPISKAYLADKGSEEMDANENAGGKGGGMTRYLAWKDAASTLAFIMGPALGGFAYQLFRWTGVAGDDNSKQISCVILSSAFASLFASASVMAFVKEGRGGRDDDAKVEKDNASKRGSGPDSGGGGDKEEVAAASSSSKMEASGGGTSSAISCPLGTKLWTGVASVACVTALYHAADSTFFAFFPLLLRDRLGFGTQAVGMAFTASAVLSFAMSAFVSSRFLRRYGPVAACTAGLGAAGTGLMVLGKAASLPPGANVGVVSALILVASALYYSGVPLYGPSVPTMLMQCVPPNKRGAVMGVDGTVNTLARVLSPLIMGEIHRVRGAGTSFKLAGSLVYGAVSIALFRRWLVLRKSFATKSEDMVVSSEP